MTKNMLEGNDDCQKGKLPKQAAKVDCNKIKCFIFLSVESPEIPWTPWTFTIDSEDCLANVQGHSGKSPGSQGRLDDVQEQSPVIQQRVRTLSRDNTETVQGVQTVDVHGVFGLHPGTVIIINADLVRKLEVQVASLEIDIHIILRKSILLFELITCKQLIIFK